VISQTEKLSMAAVIGVHQQAGRIGLHLVGLSDQDAYELFAVYGDLLGASNVKDVNAHLQTVEAFIDAHIWHRHAVWRWAFGILPMHLFQQAAAERNKTERPGWRSCG